MRYITLDGTEYKVNVVYPSLERSFELMVGSNEGANILGGDIPDVLSTKYGYEFSIEPDENNYADYDAFFYAISAPVNSHTITLPFGQTTLTFACRILSGTDNYVGKQLGHESWKHLTVRIAPVNPQRYKSNE